MRRQPLLPVTPYSIKISIIALCLVAALATVWVVGKVHHSTRRAVETQASALPIQGAQPLTPRIRSRPELTAVRGARAEPGRVAPRLLKAYGDLPLTFEANQGQTDSRVKFLSLGSSYSLFLTPREAVLALAAPSRARDAKRQDRRSRAAALRMRLVGSNPSPELVGLDELPGRSNYFIGRDPKKWRTNPAK